MIFARKKMRAIVSLVMGCMMMGSFCSCNFMGASSGSESADSTDSSNSATVFEDSTALMMTEFSDPVSLVPYEIELYLQADPDQSVADFLTYGKARLDKGEPVCIEYSLDNPNRLKVLEEKVDISLTEDFSTIDQTLYFSSRQSQVEVYNLLTNTTYYYRVSVSLENGDVHTKWSSFETAPSLRFINLDGACNVRDIGGWKTVDGKTIKQGLLYRGSEIDGGKESGYDFCLTEKGIAQLRSLGIKTDFDLRSESVKVDEYSILGEDVARTFYNAAQYQDVLRSSNKETVRKIFSDLSKPEAYPVYLHCTHGVDRAGSTALVLESLLGVAEEDLIRDYELSAFYHQYTHVNRTYANGGVVALIEGLKGFEGETLAEKTENFLLSVGVTEAEIASIRAIFLG